MLNGVLSYVVDWPAACPVTWKYPSEMFELASTEALVIGTKLIIFEPVTPSLGRRGIDRSGRAIRQNRIGSCVLAEAQAKSPRAMTAVRSPVHPCVMRIISS